MHTKHLILSAALGLTSALALGQSITINSLSSPSILDLSGYAGTAATEPDGLSFSLNVPSDAQRDGGFFDFDDPPGLSGNNVYAFRESSDDPVLAIIRKRGAATGNSSAFVNMTVLNNTGTTLTNFTINYDVFQITEGSRSTTIEMNWNPGSGFTTDGLTGNTPYVSITKSDTGAPDLLDTFIVSPRSVQVDYPLGIENGETFTIGFNWFNPSGESGNHAHVGVGNISVIPEPGTLGLLAISGLALYLFRRRK